MESSLNLDTGGQELTATTAPQSTQSTESSSASSYAADDWRANLAPELQQVASKFPTIESMVKGYMSAESLIGKRVKDYSAEDKQAYAQMMTELTGVPADASGYNIQVREGTQLDQNEVDFVKNLSAQYGLTNEQAQGISNTLDAIKEQDFNQTVEEIGNSFHQLANMWGNAYQHKLQAVNAAVTDIFPRLLGITADQFKEAIGPVYMNPLLMEGLAKIGELALDSGNMGYGAMTATDAHIRLEQMKKDPQIQQALFNNWHPQHKALREEFDRLVKMVA